MVQTHAPVKVYVVYATFSGEPERITHYWIREQAEKCAVNFAKYGAWVEEREPETEVDRPQGTGRVPR